MARYAIEHLEKIPEEVSGPDIHFVLEKAEDEIKVNAISGEEFKLFNNIVGTYNIGKQLFCIYDSPEEAYQRILADNNLKLNNAVFLDDVRRSKKDLKEFNHGLRDKLNI